MVYLRPRSRSVLLAVCAKCCSSGFGETELSAGGNVKSNLKLILKEPGLQQVVVLLLVKGQV